MSPKIKKNHFDTTKNIKISREFVPRTMWTVSLFSNFSISSSSSAPSLVFFFFLLSSFPSFFGFPLLTSFFGFPLEVSLAPEQVAPLEVIEQLNEIHVLLCFLLLFFIFWFEINRFIVRSHSGTFFFLKASTCFRAKTFQKRVQLKIFIENSCGDDFYRKLSLLPALPENLIPFILVRLRFWGRFWWLCDLFCFFKIFLLLLTKLLNKLKSIKNLCNFVIPRTSSRQNLLLLHQKIAWNSSTMCTNRNLFWFISMEILLNQTTSARCFNLLFWWFSDRLNGRGRLNAAQETNSWSF